MSLTGSVATNQELNGAISGGEKMRGRIAGLSVYYTDAYAIAVANGFDGTVVEWLESLHGKDATDEQVAAAVAAYMAENQISSASIGEVTLYANAWRESVAGDSLYFQEVDIVGVTENSQVDLTPSIEQLAIFHHKDLAFVTENVDGKVKVYALGDKPTNDYTIQVTITEVYV